MILFFKHSQVCLLFFGSSDYDLMQYCKYSNPVKQKKNYSFKKQLAENK